METLLHEAGFRIEHFQDEDDGYLLLAGPDKRRSA
jgi:hypothetical protein